MGVGAGVKVAGVKLKAEANIAVGTAEIDNKGTLKLEGSEANIKGEAGFGKTKGNASVDLVKGTLEVPLNANSSIKGNIKVADYELKGERGPITINDVAEL